MRAPERRPNGLTFLSFFRMTDVRAYSGITTFQLCTLFPMTSQIEISTGLLFCNWFKEVYLLDGQKFIIPVDACTSVLRK